MLASLNILQRGARTTIASALCQLKAWAVACQVRDIQARLCWQLLTRTAPEPPHYPGLSEDAIQKDLTSELPTWILSCYGPGRDAPEQLFGGYPREQSFEEIRLHFYNGLMAGNPQGAVRSSAHDLLASDLG